MWKAGPWRPATGALQSNLADTQQPGGDARPPGEDSLCYPLRSAEPGRVTVGRATNNDVVLNDLTASRQQFVLVRDQGNWFLEDPSPNLLLDGVAPGGWAGPLKSGSVVQVAELRLTFYTPAGFVDLLRS